MSSIWSSFVTGWRAIVFCFLLDSALLPFAIAGEAMGETGSQPARNPIGTVFLVAMITWLGSITPKIIAVGW